MGVCGQRHAPDALTPGLNRYPLYRRLCGPRAGQDGCGRTRPHRDSIPGPSSQWQVAIPTALSQPTELQYYSEILILANKIERRYSQDDHILSKMVIISMGFLDHVT
jgi:hypothetical protein